MIHIRGVGNAQRATVFGKQHQLGLELDGTSLSLMKEL
jgi:hypothetical protein